MLKVRSIILICSLLAGTHASAQAPNTLKVGSTPAGVPLSFLDTKTNSMQGVMVDVVQEVGKRSGHTIQIEPMQFGSLIASVLAKKVDLIAAGMYITPARKEQISFTDPFYAFGEGLVVPLSDTKDYTSFDDMKGYVVGAQVGTVYVDTLKKHFPEVKVYDTIPDIVRDVASGRIKAGFADFPVLAYNVQQGTFQGVRVVKSYKSSMTGQVGLGVKKDDPELLAKVNAAIAAMQSDGTIKKIVSKWGVE